MNAIAPPAPRDTLAHALASSADIDTIASAADALWEARDNAHEPTPRDYPSERWSETLHRILARYDDAPRGHWSDLTPADHRRADAIDAERDAEIIAAKLEFVAWVRAELADAKELVS